MPQPQSENRPDGAASSLAFPLLVAVAGLIVLVVLLLAPSSLTRLAALDTAAADVRSVLFAARTDKEHPQVVIVGVGSPVRVSPAAAGGISRDRLARIVDIVDAAGARAIGFDLPLLRPSTPAQDTALHIALRDARATVVLAAADERERLTAEERGYQVAFFAAAGRQTGFRMLQREPDGMVRYHAGVAPGTRYGDSFPLLLARTVKPATAPTLGRIAWLQRSATVHPFTWLFEWSGRSPFLQIAGEDLLDQDRRELRMTLRGKIVLIGDDTLSGEAYRTPLTSLSGEEASDVQVHAQAVSQLLDGRVVATLQPDTIKLLLLAIGCAGGLFGWWLHGRSRLASVYLLLLLAWLVIDAIFVSRMQLVVPLFSCLIAWLAGILTGHHIGLAEDRLVKRAAARSRIDQ